MCINEANRLSGESDNDVESINNDEFFGCLFKQSEPKKDDATKWIEGFLSAISIHNGLATNAGGVEIFIKDNISYNICPNLNLNISHCEDMWIKLHQKVVHMLLVQFTGILIRISHYFMTNWKMHLTIETKIKKFSILQAI